MKLPLREAGERGWAQGKAVVAEHTAGVVLEKEVQRERGGRSSNRVLIDEAVQNANIQGAGHREDDGAGANDRRQPKRRADGRVTAARRGQNRVHCRRIEGEASDNRIAKLNSGDKVVDGDLGDSPREVERDHAGVRAREYHHSQQESSQDPGHQSPPDGLGGPLLAGCADTMHRHWDKNCGEKYFVVG